ncbi:MAG TPA: hypothetical protein VL360_01435 [Gammaproteobacteria bacterium]|jgi:hypothetical protein|nr:hypothetical protein [Gammaproteobacteria bacterium]
MCPTLFESRETKVMQNNVRELFAAMTPEFREHLMRSFMWTEDKLEDYLGRDKSLGGDDLKDAYSHLESLLARIESFACEKSSESFPTYDEWVDEEYQKYKTEHREDVEEIHRLVGEGGVYSPGKTSPIDTMDNDSLSYFNQMKTEFDIKQKRSIEADELVRTPQYKNLQAQAAMMHEMILESVKHKV